MSLCCDRRLTAPMQRNRARTLYERGVLGAFGLPGCVWFLRYRSVNPICRARQRSCALKDFKSSPENHLRNAIRRFIRGAKSLSANERLILSEIVNLWFHYKNMPQKCISPGRARLAKKALCSEATVKRALAKFRDMGILHPIMYEKGGKKNTRYQVCLVSVIRATGGKLPQVLEGELVELDVDTGSESGSESGSNCDMNSADIMRNDYQKYRVKMTHVTNMIQ